jgi:UDP-N-acetylglucosamine 2-epimerase (non-hydrolysing)
LKLQDGSVGQILYTAAGDKAFSRERYELFSENSVCVIDDFKEASFIRNGVKKKDKSLNQDMGYNGELTSFFNMIKHGGSLPVTFENYVNSTLACALTTVKLGIPVAHVEAGLRSFDRSMPEEINRVATDALSDFLFTTEKSANKNLMKEGISKKRIFFVGNVMIDTLLKFKAKAEQKAKIKLKGLDFALLTLHRPTNVDNKKTFKDLLQTLKMVSKHIPIIFPAHPRTQKQIKTFGYEKYFNLLELHSKAPINPKNSINLSGPLSYLEFINLMAHAKMVFTDSGGGQEETTILGVPCLTIRQNTERPITIEEGTNILVGSDRSRILEESFKILNGEGKKGKIPKLWDGKASERIVNILLGRPYEPFNP